MLAKAAKQASEKLGLPSSAFALVLGTSPEVAAIIKSGGEGVDPEDPVWDSALKLVQIYLALTALLGSAELVAEWMQSPNKGLNGRPITLMDSPAGVAAIRSYLDRFI